MEILFLLNGNEAQAFGKDKILPCQGRSASSIVGAESLGEFVDYICKNYSVGGNPLIALLPCDDSMKHHTLEYAQTSHRPLAVFTPAYLLPKLARALAPHLARPFAVKIFGRVWDVGEDCAKPGQGGSVHNWSAQELARAFFACAGKANLEDADPAEPQVLNSDMARFIAASKIQPRGRDN